MFLKALVLILALTSATLLYLMVVEVSSAVAPDSSMACSSTLGHFAHTQPPYVHMHFLIP